MPPSHHLSLQKIALFSILALILTSGIAFAVKNLINNKVTPSEIISQSKIPTLAPSANVTPEPTVPPSIDTTNWKTYTTKTFSIKYPNIWNEPKSFLQSTRTEYVFNPSSLDIVEGSYYDQSIGRTRTYEEEVTLGEQNAQDKTDIKVAGFSAVKYLYSSPKPKVEVILSSKEGLIYWISMEIPSPQDVTLFDQILSTFKFTE